MRSAVFLPGILCDEAIWARQVSDLSELAACSVVDLSQDSSIEAMAARVIVTAPRTFTLVGISMGGYVALEIMRRFPERVEALALFDTSAAPDSAERQKRRKAGIDSLKVGKFAGVTKSLLPDLVHQRHIDGPVGQELRTMASRVGQGTYLRQQQAILDRSDFRPVLDTIRVPTLIAVGEGDVLTPPSASLELHMGIRTSSFTLLRDCGHLPSIEVPQETTALLKAFLSG